MANDLASESVRSGARDGWHEDESLPAGRYQGRAKTRPSAAASRFCYNEIEQKLFRLARAESP